ncbi:box C/D snoRNA protein 1 [Aethina tumida]|uniref:box C/D snoRNA protein 1 n=1 Tax=Aethina tumida TaxID=116153 RepID=UPI002149935B|nr:box C/D snoRNA protein 1 [Aethina tumida]
MMEIESTSSSVSTEISEKARLGECEVCGFHQAKYTCPRCEVKTCSLKCNKIHKLEVECDGQRDRTKFIPINKFTNMDLSSDYRLLEEITRSLEASKKKYKRSNKMPNFIPPHLLKLRYAANSKHILLKYLPNEFGRHRKNTTRLDFKTKKIHWHVDWVFVNADNLKISETVPEDQKLSLVLQKYLVKQDDEALQEKLQYYQAVDLPGIHLYLKAEQKAGKKFYELDASDTLTECLRRKLVIEYPTIHVVLKGHESLYNVIDTDDENEQMETDEIKSGKEVVDRIINNAEDEDSLYRSLKNLLFVSEYSDDELSNGE